ncbi:MAG: histidinol dehydrogenase [Gammaproteobacteria bacterium]|nr:histidinol dehydrogenase [Gammaproteobacteria bacterium]
MGAELNIRRMHSAAPHFDRELEALTGIGAETADVTEAAAQIVTAVKERGDAALVEFTNRFDGTRVTGIGELRLHPEEFRQAFDSLTDERRTALEDAAARIDGYHRRQARESWSYEDELGNRLGARVTALDRVGVYVPGGLAAYPSTVLMTIVPARVAGVGEVVVTMPTPSGARNPMVLAALHLVGVTEAYAIGGAQAVAALAWGTETIGAVDKILGPGNAYVAAAKRQVYGKTGIDLIAGPSEILIVTDGTAPMDWLAYDLFSQAEHDELAQSLLLCPDRGYLDALATRMAALIGGRERRDIIARSLEGRGALIETASLEEAVEISNRIAPEHLMLAVRDPEALLENVRHAGAIFLGAHSPEVMGDYVAGPSHVLPTYGTARFSSPLGVEDFQKRSSVIALSPEGCRALSGTASVLARSEGLEAHALAAEVRDGRPEPRTGH